MSEFFRDAFPSCRFYVTIGSMPQAVFTEVQGLSVEIKTDDYEEGGANGFVHRLPGRVNVSNLILKRGLTKSNEFFKWLMDVSRGNIRKENITLELYDYLGNPVGSWNFFNAYPVKWSGPSFTAGSNSIAIESLELAHDGLEMNDG